MDAEKTEPQWSKRFVEIYKTLYKIEKEIKELTIEKRYHRRQNESLPILDALFLCDDFSPRCLKFVRSNMVASGRFCRERINKAMRRIANRYSRNLTITSLYEN